MDKDPFRGLGSTRRKHQNETDLKNTLDKFFKTQSPEIIYMSEKKKGHPMRNKFVVLFGFLVLTSCRASAIPSLAGSLVTLPVTLSTGTQSISAVQFDLNIPIGISTETTTAGSSSITAQKQIVTSMVNGDLRVLISGVNQTAIPSGPIALITLRLASNLPTTSFQMNLSNIAASDPSGNNVTLSSSVSGVLSVIANVLPFLKVGSN